MEPSTGLTGRLSFDAIEAAIEAFRNGEFLVVMDDESRENEGDLMLAAQFATTEKFAFLVRHTSGLVCLPIVGERLDELGISLMVPKNTEAHRTAFTVSVDYGSGTTTGISAHDRALTARKLADPMEKDGAAFTRPGHIFPLRYQPGGVLKRGGHTEASIDLCRLAGLQPAAIICELVRDEDGLMSRRDDCMDFANRHGLKIITIAALIEYLRRTQYYNGEVQI